LLSSLETAKSIERVREDLTRACAKHKFGILGVHDLKAKMRARGLDFGGDCLVFEVMKPLDASRALPCRISVYSTPEGKTRIATLRPTELHAVFGTEQPWTVAREVEATLEAILAEAAG
jgi:uncharacterized protein (DUF302 family)